MWRINISKILGYVIALFGVLSVVGYVLEVDFLKILFPDVERIVRMEFLAAVCFVLAGIELVLNTKLIFNEDRYGVIEIIIPILSLLILLVMSTLLFSVTVDIDYHITGEVIEETMMQPIMGMGIGMEMTGSVGSVFPPIVTMFNFVLISLSGLFVILDIRGKGKILFLLGMVVLVIGALAVIGHILNYPALYYQYNFSGRTSSPMTIDAALIFIVWGLGMMICSRGKHGENV